MVITSVRLPFTKHLLQTIQQQRDEIPLNDFELRTLFMDKRRIEVNGQMTKESDRKSYMRHEKVVMDERLY